MLAFMSPPSCKAAGKWSSRVCSRVSSNSKGISKVQNDCFASIDFTGINNITASYLAFTQSYYSASSSVNSRLVALEGYVDVDNYVLTASYNTDSASFDSRLDSLEGYIDVDNYVTTASYNVDSASFDSRIKNATNEEYIAGFLTTASFNQFTQSVNTTTASLLTSVSNLNIATASLNAATSSYETKGRGIVSGSSQLASAFEPIAIDKLLCDWLPAW